MIGLVRVPPHNRSATPRSPPASWHPPQSSFPSAVLPPPATPTPSGTPTDAGRDLESIQQLNATLDGIAILGGGHLPGEDVFHQSHMLLSNDRDGGFAGSSRVPRGFRPQCANSGRH